MIGVLIFLTLCASRLGVITKDIRNSPPSWGNYPNNVANCEAVVMQVPLLTSILLVLNYMCLKWARVTVKYHNENSPCATAHA
jgi:hypothetical protein